MIHRERDKVLRVLALAKDLQNNHDELQGHWGRYSCLLCAGYFEVALRLVIQRRIEKKSAPEIQRFVQQNLESIQNPKAERFSKVIRSFSQSWGDSLDQYFIDNVDVKEAIDSLMANRHLIAHGKSCSISVGRVTGYFKSADKAIDYLDDMLNPT
jgi:protein tyrosine phosphatase